MKVIKREGELVLSGCIMSADDSKRARGSDVTRTALHRMVDEANARMKAHGPICVYAGGDVETTNLQGEVIRLACEDKDVVVDIKVLDTPEGDKIKDIVNHFGSVSVGAAPMGTSDDSGTINLRGATLENMSIPWGECAEHLVNELRKIRQVLDQGRLGNESGRLVWVKDAVSRLLMGQGVEVLPEQSDASGVTITMSKNKPTSKPTLEELEAILNAGEEPPIEILPNGEVRAIDTIKVTFPSHDGCVPSEVVEAGLDGIKQAMNFVDDSIPDGYVKIVVMTTEDKAKAINKAIDYINASDKSDPLFSIIDVLEKRDSAIKSVDFNGAVTHVALHEEIAVVGTVGRDGLPQKAIDSIADSDEHMPTPDGYEEITVVAPKTCYTCGKVGCTPQNHAGWHPDDDGRA